jgi:hypothetical protein
MRNKLFLIALLTFATLGSSQECKKRPDLIAACYVVHGRAQYGNGTPALRIWHVGTKHKYGVFPDNPSAVPKSLLDALSTFDHSVYGDYELCPLTQEKMGVMTMVCIESAKNLVVTESGTTKLVKQQGKPVSTR